MTNTTEYTFDEVFRKVPLPVVLDVSQSLNKARVILLDALAELLEIDEYTEEDIGEITTQLYYVEKNIKVFEDVILAHESKIFETRIDLGDLNKYSLN